MGSSFFLDLGQVRGLGIIRPMSNMSTWHSPKLKPRTSRQLNSSTKPVPVPRSRSRKNSVTPSKAPIPSDRKSNSGNYKSGKFFKASEPSFKNCVGSMII